MYTYTYIYIYIYIYSYIYNLPPVGGIRPRPCGRERAAWLGCFHPCSPLQRDLIKTRLV